MHLDATPKPWVLSDVPPEGLVMNRLPTLEPLTATDQLELCERVLQALHPRLKPALPCPPWEEALHHHLKGRLGALQALHRKTPLASEAVPAAWTQLVLATRKCLQSGTFEGKPLVHPEQSEALHRLNRWSSLVTDQLRAPLVLQTLWQYAPIHWAPMLHAWLEFDPQHIAVTTPQGHHYGHVALLAALAHSNDGQRTASWLPTDWPMHLQHWTQDLMLLPTVLHHLGVAWTNAQGQAPADLLPKGLESHPAEPCQRLMQAAHAMTAAHLGQVLGQTLVNETPVAAPMAQRSRL